VIAYVDTSALLRIVLRESGAVDDLRAYDGLVSSGLIAVEVHGLSIGSEIKAP
jgi:hypothetical protein